MKKTGKSGGLRLLGLAALAAVFVGLGARSAAASEFEVVADSLTVVNQTNVSSVTYYGAKTTLPGNPNTATQLTTPGGLYFDGANYKVWERSLSAWVNVATGTVVSGGVTGSGTLNKVTKWTAAGAVGNSSITDDATTVTMAPSGGVTVTPLLTASAGVTVTAGGATVTAGGVTVNGGGLSVTAGNLTMTGTGTADILGFRVTKAGGVTTLRNGTGGALVNIK